MNESQDPPIVSPHRATILVALFTLAALAVRIRYIGQPMRVDESYTYLAFASKPLRYGLSHYFANNHLFHTVLVHLAVRLFWNSPVIVRLPALLAGVALVPATYVMASRLYNSTAGLIAAGLVASSSTLIEYSVNARGYSIVALAFVLLVALAPELLRAQGLGVWWLYLTLVVVGFFTVLTMAFAFGSVVTWLALEAFRHPDVDRRRFFARLGAFSAGAGVVTLALYTPAIVVSGAKAIFADPYAASVGFSRWRAGLPHLAGSVWTQWNRGVPWPVAASLAVAALGALVLHRRVATSRVPVPIAAAAWILLQLVIQRVLPFERVWLFLLPLYLSLTAAGISLLLERVPWSLRAAVPVAAAALAAGLAISVMSFRIIPRSHESGMPEAERIAVDLHAMLRNRDRLLAVTPAQHPLAYYFVMRGYPTAVLSRPLRETSRLFVIVDSWEGQTLQTPFRGVGSAIVRADGSISVARFGPPTEVRRYPGATIYELDRLTST